MSLQRAIQYTSCLVLGWVFGDGGSIGAISGSNKSKMGPPPSWKNFKWPYLRKRSSDPLHVWLYGGVFWDGGSNGSTFDSNKIKIAPAAILDNFERPYLRNGSRSTYIDDRAMRGQLCDCTAFLSGVVYVTYLCGVLALNFSLSVTSFLRLS